MTPPTHRVAIRGEPPIEIATLDIGTGPPFLLLHGGAGPQSVQPFGEQFAAVNAVRVLVPTHPGFGGTLRPDDLTGIPRLAELYVQLLDDLDLHDVTVIGNSIGGWIAAELALQSPRAGGLVLIDAVGLDVAGHPVADFFAMSMDEVFERTFHDPTPFRFDPTTLPPAAQAIAAGNRDALAAYTGTSMSDPSLAGRLSGLRLPTLVLWGASDRIVDADYGRAYARAIPGARFQLLTNTGHAPQQETPDQVIQAIRASGITGQAGPHDDRGGAGPAPGSSRT